MDSIEARLARLEQRVDKLDTHMSHVLRRLDNIDLVLTDLRVASRDERTEYQVLKERVAELEERLARLEAGRDE